MDRCISKFIEKTIDEAQNEVTKEIEHSTIAYNIKNIDTVLFMIKMVGKGSNKVLEPQLHRKIFSELVFYSAKRYLNQIAKFACDTNFDLMLHIC